MASGDTLRLSCLPLLESAVSELLVFCGALEGQG